MHDLVYSQALQIVRFVFLERIQVDLVCSSFKLLGPLTCFLLTRSRRKFSIVKGTPCTYAIRGLRTSVYFRSYKPK